jgi:hypothetical protein
MCASAVDIFKSSFRRSDDVIIVLTLGSPALATPSSEFILALCAASLLVIDLLRGADKISRRRSAGISGVRVV